MSIAVPPVAEVKRLLEGIGHAQLHTLAELSGVPFGTLWKIRSGVTTNPGIETVRKFISHVAAARGSALA